jgi:hypothetical protein
MNGAKRAEAIAIDDNKPGNARLEHAECFDVADGGTIEIYHSGRVSTLGGF